MENSQESAQPAGPSRRLPEIIRQHPLLFYFLMAFAFSWAYEVIAYGVFHPQRMVVRGLLQIPLTFVGPTLSAFIMTALTQGKAGVQRLLRRYVLWQVDIHWYLLVLLAPPILWLLGLLVLPGGAAAFDATRTAAFLVSYLTGFVITFLIGGPLGEEPGWRGFALPRLQYAYGPLVGTLILGVLWAAWHLPLLILIPGYNGAGTGFVGILIPFLEFVITIMGLTIVITWVFNNAGGSLLLTMLLHGSVNTATNTVPKLFPTLPQTTVWVQVLGIVLQTVPAVLIIVLTRGRLSHVRYQHEAEALDLAPHQEGRMEAAGPVT